MLGRASLQRLDVVTMMGQWPWPNTYLAYRQSVPRYCVDDVEFLKKATWALGAIRGGYLWGYLSPFRRAFRWDRPPLYLCTSVPL